jgi:hypothetical protein
MTGRDSLGPHDTSTLVPDELSSEKGTGQGLSGRGGSLFLNFRAFVVLLVVLGLGLPISFLASAYAHRQEHRWVAPTSQQYEGYVAGFAFAREHPMPDGEVANVDYCDATARRFNRTAGNWLYFSRGCQDATGWTAGDPPPRPMSKVDFQENPR